MTQVIVLRSTSLQAKRKVYRFLGYRQGRKQRGQKDHAWNMRIFLPCRIAARRRSSRSSAWLYPPSEHFDCIIPLLAEKVGSNSL